MAIATEHFPRDGGPRDINYRVMHCDTLTRKGGGDYGDKTGGWDWTKGSTRLANIFRAGWPLPPLPTRHDRAENGSFNETR